MSYVKYFDSNRFLRRQVFDIKIKNDPTVTKRI